MAEITEKTPHKPLSPAAAPRGGLSLGTRFFLVTASIVAAAVVAAVGVTAIVGQRIASDAVDRALERTGSVQAAFQEESLEQLRLTARLFANDPPFAAYVDQAITLDDPLSVLDQLAERRLDLGFDLAIVLDPDGRVFARTDDATPGREDLSGEPLVAAALEEYEAWGTWASRGRLYDAAAVPIGAGGILVGFLIAGNEIGDQDALLLRQVSDAEVAFLLHGAEGPRLVASTLDARLTDALENHLAELPEPTKGADQVLPLELDGRRFIALVRPLAGVSDDMVGNVVALASFDEELAPYRRIQTTLFLVGLVAVLVALVFSYLVSRRVLRPIGQLVEAAQAAAEGDYDRRIPVVSADEVGRLADAFNKLLSELREKRDMELYISELARNVSEEEESVAAAQSSALLTATQALQENRSAMPPGGATPPSAEASSTGALGEAARTTLTGVGPGGHLGQRFFILAELGAGGMGVVYKARDNSLGELVALKMLKNEQWNAEQLAHLKEELKLARRISHPNVLRTYDFGELEGVPFISMEYVRGITLRRLLDQSGRLPLSAGLHLARQLCRGLRAAHRQGVIHRDIKPENLIVEHAGNVKLMDFGIAQKARRRPSPQAGGGEVVGTPYYLAPEQLEGFEADVRSDLYASGVVLYEIFTGALPYESKAGLMELLQTKLNEPPVPPRQKWEAMPEDLERILLRCLARRPEERYADVEALLAELEVLRG